jgi:hypothetical protein
MMMLMSYSEGQSVELTADARISDTAYIATGTWGYVEQVTTRRHTKSLMGVTIEVGSSEVVALVHFHGLGLKSWVPASILQGAPGS